jgi:hypothetical protein
MPQNEEFESDLALDMRLADCATVDQDFDWFEPAEISEYLNIREQGDI